jgi:hypothetical protein
MDEFLFEPGVALLPRSRPTRVTAFAVLTLAEASARPAFLRGERGYPPMRAFQRRRPRWAHGAGHPSASAPACTLPSPAPPCRTTNRNTNTRMPKRCLLFSLASALGVVSCASPPPPLPTDHPASATAPEAPAPRPIRYFSSDADSQRTKQLLAQAARQGQPGDNAPGQGKTKDQQNMPGMRMPGHQH